jgi:hypothetical protein
MYFCFRLAHILGMPVAELSERVTYAELVHWIAYVDEENELAKPPAKRRPRLRRPSPSAMKKQIDDFVAWGKARETRLRRQGLVRG